MTIEAMPRIPKASTDTKKGNPMLIERTASQGRRNKSAWLALLLLAGCSAGGAPNPSAGVPGANIADVAMNGGMPRVALNVTRAILRSNPRDIGALTRQGDALAELNEPDAAMEAYQRALALEPDAPAALLGLGRLDLSHGKAEDAGRCFTRLLASDPNNQMALNNLGVALDLSGRHEAAQQVYGKLLRLAPGDRAASINLAVSLSLSGQAGRSVAMLRGLATGPDATPRLRQDLAMALTLSGSRREAEKLLLTDLSPRDTAAALAGYQALDAPNK
jgi:Flp pilus assembly protein TadD